MECEYCDQKNPDDVSVCINCGKDIICKEKAWHSLHKLLWDKDIDHDILDTLNELSQREKVF